jgi:iron complex outermembrane receptor protein
LPGISLAVKAGEIELERTTDAEGGFAFDGLPPRTYELRATADGFLPIHQTLAIDPGQVITVTLTMTPLLTDAVIVTATKSGEADAQKTPIAVSRLSGEELKRREDHNLSQLAGQAPSVTFSQNNGFGQLTIRGIGTNVVFAGSDPSSAVYVDGVYFARPVMILGDFLDLDRVEVLRGPQGILYGRNAVGGAINLVSRGPTDSFETSARLSAGTGDFFRTEAQASGPIGSPKLTGSAAFLRGVRRGFVNDLNHPEHPLGSDEVTAGRGQIKWAFNDRASLLLSGDLSHQTPTPLTYAKVLQIKPGFQLDNPPGSHDVRASTLATNRNVQYGGAARLSVALTPFTQLSSLSSYRTLDYDLFVDADISELALTTSHVHEKQHQTSEELIVSHQRQRVNWLGGLFVFDELDRQPTVVGFPSSALESTLDPRVEASTWALFGQTTVGLTSRISAIAGLRYSDERKTIDNAGHQDRTDAGGALVDGASYSYTDTLANSAWTPKIGLDVQLNPVTLLYASATRGFKSGGFNLTSKEKGLGYAPEFVWSYESGVKTTSAGGRARLNAAVFHADYSDLQVQTSIRPGVIDISNAAHATIDGVEVETSALLTTEVQAGGHVSWLNARYDRYLAVGVGGVTGDVAGNHLTNAPEWSGRLWIQWDRPTGANHSVSLLADAAAQTTVYFTPFNDTIQRQVPYGQLNLSAEFGPKTRRWSAGILARNITNQNFITGSFSSPPPAIGGRPGEPREISVQFAIRR